MIFLMALGAYLVWSMGRNLVLLQRAAGAEDSYETMSHWEVLQADVRLIGAVSHREEERIARRRFYFSFGAAVFWPFGAFVLAKVSPSIRATSTAPLLADVLLAVAAMASTYMLQEVVATRRLTTGAVRGALAAASAAVALAVLSL